ncbi:hypothetical protein B296_00035177 [Ensete ventricosum]|uniref:Uncharacterized protein n=1 Tax=Ensete ventricosum TaxID=4639 RepID=A0A426ZUU9_ENSVE|nr:hypothetical protein B296_00035177 [Ensete ventricosum]
MGWKSKEEAKEMNSLWKKRQQGRGSDGRGGRGDRNRLRATTAVEEGAAAVVIEEEEGSDGRGGRGDGQTSCGR